MALFYALAMLLVLVSGQQWLAVLPESALGGLLVLQGAQMVAPALLRAPKGLLRLRQGHADPSRGEARALVTNPKLLIFDEATEGLAPLIREEIWRCIEQLRQAGQTLIVVDKYVSRLVRIADRHIILEKGRVAWQGSSEALATDKGLWHRYLGV